jgi:hypothetical protein
MSDQTDTPSAAGSPVASGWRDRIKVHPAAKAYPMMSDAELDDLAKDIEKNDSLRHGITLWTPAKWNAIGKKKQGENLFAWAQRKKFDLYLVDGRNRLAAIDRIPDAELREALLGTVFSLDGYEFPCTLLFGDDERDIVALVESLNLQRRHLTADQKRDAIAALLRADPTRSDREIAKATDSSPTTVGRIRATEEAAGTVSTVDTRTGADGVAQPAHKPATPKPAAPLPAAKAVEQKPTAAPASPPKPAHAPPTKSPEAQIRAQAITVISGLLHRELGETLEDIIRMVKNESAAVDKLSATKRVALVRGFMQALGISLDDLRPMS